MININQENKNYFTRQDLITELLMTHPSYGTHSLEMLSTEQLQNIVLTEHKILKETDDQIEMILGRM